MKSPARILLAMALMLAYACDRPEEVVPEKPVATPQGTVVLTPIPGEVADSTAVDSTATDSTATDLPPADTTAVDTTAVDTTAVNPPAKGDPDPNVDSAVYRFAKYKDMPFRIMFPRDYDPTKSYPLLLFLHGIGESGTDNKRQLTWGASLFQEDSIRENYPAFIVFPQCPTTHYWFDEPEMGTLRGLINNLLKQYLIDESRIYIGGLSMGAYGTYAMVADNPDLFAAAVAISGDGNAGNAPKMSKTKWRIFAGGRDEKVSSKKSEKMAKALEKAGAKVSFKIYPNADHLGSWVQAFAEPDFCHWIFSVRRDQK
jgi:predicted peptidase